MADDATPNPESEPVIGAPAARHDPGVIEGEATRISDAAAESSPAQSPPPETPPETLAAAPPGPTPTLERGSGGAFVWGICGVVVGAAVALVAAWYFDPQAAPMRDLAARQSALEAATATQSATVQALDARLAKLESGAVNPEAVAAAQMEARGARDVAASALAAAQQAAKTAAPAAGGGPDPRVGKLETEQAALAERMAKLEAGAGKVSATTAPPAAPAALPDPRIGELESSEAALGDRVGKIEATLAAPKTESRVAPSEVAPKSDVAGQAIAALALEQRLRAGEPFAAEWAALSRLGADPAPLATLKPYADTGAPTAAALAAAFAKIAPSLAVAGNPEPGGGVVDRMLDHMRSLVRVHAVGEVAGEEPSALVSQIEAALARGQTASALAIYARLPEAARKAAEDWANTAEARGAADSAARSLRESAIERLAAPKN